MEKQNRDDLPSDKAFSKSPFLYHDGIKSELFNKNYNCTYDEISSLTISGTLNETDWLVIEALYKYKYLNRYCLEVYLDSLEERKKGFNLKNNLRKLVSLGIVLRYYFVWSAVETLNKTPCYYTLSKGCYTFMHKKHSLSLIMNSNFSEFTQSSEISILNQLVFNQFHIHFLRQYKKAILRERYYDKLKIKDYEFYLEGYFRIKNKASIANNFDLVVFPIRRNPNWQHELIIKLSRTYAFAQKHPLVMRDPIILVICEDDLQVKEAFLYNYFNTTTKNIFTLYTSDVSLVSEDILKHLITCEIDTDVNMKSINKVSDDDIRINDGKDIKKDNFLFDDGSIKYDPLDSLHSNVKSIEPGSVKFNIQEISI